MSMAEIKANQRRALHARMGEPCLYRPDRSEPAIPSAEQSAGGLVLTVRFKTKQRVANSDYDGVSILEGVESLIFQDAQLAALAIELTSGDRIEIPGYNLAFELDQPLDPDGPLNVYWTVTRTESETGAVFNPEAEAWSQEAW